MDIFILLIIGLLIFSLAVWAIFTAKKQLGNKNDFAQKPDTVLQNYATIVSKEIQRVMTGSFQIPGHYIAYMIHFQYDNGHEVDISVPESVFKRLPTGMRELLITQGDNFIAFGDISATDV